MKRLLLAIAILAALLPVADARMTTVVVGGGVVGVWSCADADLVCESFDSTGFDDGGSLAATVAESAPAAVNENASNSTAVGCDDPNTYSANLNNGDSYNDCYIYWYEESSTDIYAVLWFKLETLQSGGNIRLAQIGDTAPINDEAAYCYATYVDASNFTVTCTSHAASLSTSSNLSYNTWYKLTMSYDVDGDFGATVNGESLGTNSDHSWTPQYFTISAKSVANTVIDFDAVKVSSTSLPTCE